MNSLCRRLLPPSPRTRLLSHYATKAKARAKAKPEPQSQLPNGAVSGSQEPSPEAPVGWARPSEIPFQSKVANSVQLVGYVRQPVQFRSDAGGSSWASTVLADERSSVSDGASESPGSLPLWVPVIFEDDLAHIAALHLKENDRVCITGCLSSSVRHVNSSQVQSNVQVKVNDISFVEEDFRRGKFSNAFIQSERNTSNSSDSASKYLGLVFDPWNDLADNPKDWWDIRAAKRDGSVNPKYPDFKRKDNGDGLWLDRAPRSILSKLEGIEFDAQIHVTKEGNLCKDSGNSASDLWTDLVDNPKEWCDYRNSKLQELVSRKYPDFKRKNNGAALWLDRAPRSILSKLVGLEFYVPNDGSKDAKQYREDSSSDSWTDLIDNPKEWRDYRSSKLQGLVNPKFPDFKRKDGNCALWLSGAPEWLLPKLEGLEFHEAAQKSNPTKSEKSEQLWKDLLENPEKWWDNRLDKKKESAPDFKHRETGEALWLSDSPSWAVLKLPPPKSKEGVAKWSKDV